MKKVAIVQPNYIPWKGYFDMMNRVDTFVVFDEVQYTAKDWRNRNQIKTAQGLQWLTIPVKVNSQKQTLLDTFVSDQQWRKKHWKSLTINYKKAPHFEWVAETIAPLYEKDQTEALVDIDILFMQAICHLLQIKAEIIRSSEIPQSTSERLPRIREILQHTQATWFLNGPKARSFMPDDAFAADGVELVWMTYDHYPEYPQFFPPFAHSVSMLDMLFHLGESSLPGMIPQQA